MKSNTWRISQGLINAESFILNLVIYSLIYALIFIVGVVGNGLLISSVLLRKRSSVANVFLVNLAVSDLLLCITAVPITPVLAFMKRWVFGLVLCKIVPSCQAISVLISSWCLCYIAIDRHRSIVTPLKEPWKLHHAQSVLIATWLAAVFASSPLYFSQSLKTLTMTNITLCGEFCGEFNWAQEDHTKLLYGISLLVVQFVIPAVIMSLCYWNILQKVRADWIVDEGSMLTAAQQAQTAVRKRRVMYVLILMVVVFMTSWLPLSAVNLIKDLEIPLILEQMYFKLLNVHAIAMTSVVWNPLLYFWMSKRHRRALKDDMTWLTNVRRHTNVGVLSRFTPSPSVSLVYRRTLEKHLGVPNFRRGTLADPTCMARERAPADLQSNCFLLVPLMPLCQPVMRRNTHVTTDDRALHNR
uniref:G_PROTEIN_RECEP_F1_2 domain-containing protein n=1 Tax=Angiostrongylus cantonensis TaxID=6313 RepID=A0A158P738_ANGCA